MTWTTVRLADLATVSSGGSAPQNADAFSTEGIPFVRAGSLTKLLGGHAEDSLELIQPDVASNYKLKLFPEGTVLFAKSGMSATKGHVYQLQKPAYVVNHLAALVPRSKSAGDYLRHALRFKSPTSLIKDEAYPSIRLGDIESMEIPAPKAEAERQRIAGILDQAHELRRKRQRGIDRLNQLAQAIFKEMFGDPHANDKNWTTVQVGQVTDCIVPGRDKPKSFTGEIPWITTAEIVHLGWTLQQHAKEALTMDEVKEVRAKIIPEKSVIMTCVGDLGKVSIAEIPMVINQQLHSFQCSPEINPIFLMYMLSYRQIWMTKMATQTTLPYMNKTICNSVPILLPPIELQSAFSGRIFGLSGVRRRMVSVAGVLDSLFSSLQQRAFRGEL